MERDDHIVVLNVLTKADIQKLANRTNAIRGEYSLSLSLFHRDGLLISIAPEQTNATTKTVQRGALRAEGTVISTVMIMMSTMMTARMSSSLVQLSCWVRPPRLMRLVELNSRLMLRGRLRIGGTTGRGPTLVVCRLRVGETEGRRRLRCEIGVIRGNASFIRRIIFLAGSDDMCLPIISSCVPTSSNLHEPSDSHVMKFFKCNGFYVGGGLASPRISFLQTLIWCTQTRYCIAALLYLNAMNRR